MTRLRRHARWLLVPLALVLTGAKCQGDPGHPVRRAQYIREYRYARRLFHDGRVQQDCLGWLWNRESGWNPYAVNGTSGAAGIPQANPAYFGSPFALGDWRAQIRWGKWYLGERYGGHPCSAWQHEESEGWY